MTQHALSLSSVELLHVRAKCAKFFLKQAEAGGRPIDLVGGPLDDRQAWLPDTIHRNGRAFTLGVRCISGDTVAVMYRRDAGGRWVFADGVAA